MKHSQIKQVKKIMPIRIFSTLVLLIFIILYSNSCKKYIEVDSLTDRLLSKQVFNNAPSANSAIAGIYRQWRDLLISSISINSSLASNDIKYHFSSVNNDYSKSTLQATDLTLPWNSLYTLIYQCNSAIEGLEGNNGVSEKSREYFIGEAKFNRALCYFYLVNLFGDVPLIISTDVKLSSSARRINSSSIYNQIIIDLKEAQVALGADYSFTGGDRTRANKWVATALLARVYLYLKDYNNAELESSSIINSNSYSLLNSPVGIFSKNNSEAILQWANNTTESNAVASNFIYTINPNLVCSNSLLNAFEAGDQRKSIWIKSSVYSSQIIYYPFKFTTTSVSPNEWYTIFRLSEQYLIRAEARLMRSNFTDAVADVNLVRLKHGGLTTPLFVPTDKDVFLDVIMRERQVDLFSEGMHRWLDLKRTGKLDGIMKIEKPLTWRISASLYPIPLTDIQRNPSLTQNPGYQ